MRNQILARDAAREWSRKTGRNIMTAEIGNNQGDTVVAVGSDRVWVMLHGDRNQPVRAINKGGVPTTAGIIVFVEYVKTTGVATYQILSRANATYPVDPWENTVGVHGAQHERRNFGAGGFDPVNTWTRMSPELRARQQATPDMTVYVEVGNYPMFGAEVVWSGGNSPTVTVPANPGESRCDLLYLDPANVLTFANGTAAVVADPLTSAKPTNPTGGYFPIAYIYTTNAQTTIEETNISDARLHFVGAGTSTLGALTAKNPPIDADKVVYQDSTAGDALVTSTWTQVKAFLKTYFDTIYSAVTHNLFSATHADTTGAASPVDGDTIIGNVTPAWSKLAISIPAATIRNTLGIDNGELRPSWKSDAIYSLISGARNFTGTVGGLPPVASSDFTTKEYVDTSVSFIANFYFNNTADALGGIYYKMLETATGEGESTFSSAALAVGDNQALFNFITAAGVPGVDTLAAGIYSAHIHASKVTVGGRDARIYFTIVTSDSVGGTQVTRATSETSGLITTKGDLDLHAVLAADVDIAATDRIIIKWFANISGGGNNPVVNLFAEGTTSAHLSIPTSAEILSSVFVRQDGTKPLSANWDAGSFEIRAETLESDVATGTAPLTIASTTVVANLNADTVDGVHGVHAHTDAASGGATLTSPTIVTPTIVATGWTNAKHAHAAANSGGLIPVGSLALGSQQYQTIITGATPFVPVYSGFLLDGTTGGKTVLAVTNAKVLTLTSAETGGLTLVPTASKTLTLTYTDNWNLTIPATGTAALLATANIFTADQRINNATATDAGAIQKLTVTGHTAVIQAAIGSARYFAAPSPGLEIVTTTASPISFGVNQSGTGTPSLMISSVGLIGMGITTAPGAQLDIKTATATNSILLGANTNATTYNVISLNGDATNAGHMGMTGGGGTDKNLYVDAPPTGQILFRVAAVTKMALLSDGSVGFGVTAPQGKTHGLGANSVGSFMHWDGTTPDSTATVNILATTNLVLYHISVMGVVRNSGGTSVYFNSGCAINANFTVTIGGNGLVFAVSAGGAVTVARNAGTGTWTVSIWMCYL